MIHPLSTQNQSYGSREGSFGVAKAGAHVTDHIDYSFPWVLGSIGIISDFVVSSREVVLPCGADIGWVTMLGSIENQKADVEIRSWVGVVIE